MPKRMQLGIVKKCILVKQTHKKKHMKILRSNIFIVNFTILYYKFGPDLCGVYRVFNAVFNNSRQTGFFPRK